MAKTLSKTSARTRAAPLATTGDLFQAAAERAPRSLAELNEEMAAAGPMVEGGKRAVFGEGPLGAKLAFVGEQPGDQEDLEGRPFVGPAGKLLDQALDEAGIDRATPTSRMRSSISSFSNAASGAFTRSRRWARSSTIAGGS